jgi:peptide chain release factor 3
VSASPVAVPGGAAPAPEAVLSHAAGRRTFAVISHPDAGKSTLTEALILHAHVINVAGAIHGKAGRKATVSDWMDMEQARGISITSAAMQFEYTTPDGSACVINLVDTPGHADFSEDTYRVLTAVDAAVMLIDAAKGLEPQTLKLFQVCRHRRIPVITVINKWDRPGREPLELLDEIESRIGIRPTPLTWPVGIAGDFKGVLDRRSGDFVRFIRTAGGATLAPEETLEADAAALAEPAYWAAAQEECALLDADGANHRQESFLDGATTPVLFASAVLNFGVSHLLGALVDIAPPPRPRPDIDGRPRSVESPLSAIVFKVQAGMDSNHRDRLAYARVCSGMFRRGEVLTHGPTGKPFTTKYAQSVFGHERTTMDTAWPGDVIGLVNATMLKPGDTLYLDESVQFPPIPHFAPEHFAVARPADMGKYKQFRKGIDRLEEEGVVQLLRSDKRGDQAPVLAAVGPMQFEVTAHRMESEYHCVLSLETLPYSIARRTVAGDVAFLDAQRSVEVLLRTDGALLALFTDRWRLEAVQREHPEVTLEPLAAAAD